MNKRMISQQTYEKIRIENLYGFVYLSVRSERKWQKWNISDRGIITDDLTQGNLLSA